MPQAGDLGYVARKQVNRNRWHLVARDPSRRADVPPLETHEKVKYRFARAACGEAVLAGTTERDLGGIAELCEDCDRIGNETASRAR